MSESLYEPTASRSPSGLNPSAQASRPAGSCGDARRRATRLGKRDSGDVGLEEQGVQFFGTRIREHHDRTEGWFITGIRHDYSAAPVHDDVVDGHALQQPVRLRSGFQQPGREATVPAAG